MSSKETSPKKWICRPSKSHAGRLFYFNKQTGLSQWNKPPDFEQDASGSQTENESVKLAKFRSPKKRPPTFDQTDSPKSKQTRNNDKHTPKPDESFWRSKVATFSGSAHSTPNKNTPKGTTLNTPKGTGSNKISPKPSQSNETPRGNTRNLDERSKTIKHSKSKTPSQDRLNKIIAQFNEKPGCDEKAIFIALQANYDTTPVQRHPRKSIDGNGNLALDNKRADFLDKIATKKSSQPKSRTQLQYGDLVSEKKTEPSQMRHFSNIFPLQTKAQDRLNKLQNRIRTPVIVSPEVKVLRMEFGIIDDDEEMPELEESVPKEFEPKECEPNESVPNECEPMDCDSFEDVGAPTTIATDSIPSDLPLLVPDTNIFVDAASFVCLTRAIDDGKYRIFVPFIVLQELDGLKRNQEKASIASKAIRFIYGHIQSAQNRLRGQKATHDHNHVINIDGPDDRILNCCIQLVNDKYAVTVLTNDKNLINKFTAQNIQCMTADKFLTTC